MAAGKAGKERPRSLSAPGATDKEIQMAAVTEHLPTRSKRQKTSCKHWIQEAEGVRGRRGAVEERVSKSSVWEMNGEGHWWSETRVTVSRWEESNRGGGSTCRFLTVKCFPTRISSQAFDGSVWLVALNRVSVVGATGKSIVVLKQSSNCQIVRSADILSIWSIQPLNRVGSRIGNGANVGKKTLNKKRLLI